MAFASVGSLGTGTGTSAGTSTTITTSAIGNAGNLVVVWFAMDNATAADGDNNEVTSVTDSAGGNTWTQLGEDTNNVSGAGTGATVACFYSKLTNQIANGGTITVNHSSVSDRAAKAWEFTMGAGNEPRLESTIGNNRVTAGTAHGGSILRSGLNNIEHLFIRATAIEDEALTAETATGSWTGITGLPSTTSGSNAANIFVTGEFRIVTGTSGTSSPTYTTAASTDSTSIMGALYELSVQPLTPALFTNSQSFYAPTVAATYALTPNLFTNSQSFYAPTVSATYALTADIFTNTQTFYGPTVSQNTPAQNLEPPLVTNTQTFHAATVSATYALLPVLLDDGNSFFSPTVSATYGLTPGLVTNTQTFHAPTLSANYDLAPPLLENTQTFYAPAIGIVQALLPTLVTNTSTFNAATVDIESSVIVAMRTRRKRGRHAYEGWRERIGI